MEERKDNSLPINGQSINIPNEFWLARVLERALERNARQFTRADRGMRTVRVVGSDNRKVIGLRYPASLLPHVKETVEMQWAEKFTDPSSLALLDGDGDENLNAILGVTVEAPTAIDPVSFAKCFRKTQTIMDFFGGATKTKHAPVDLTATDDGGRSKKKKKSTKCREKAVNSEQLIVNSWPA